MVGKLHFPEAPNPIYKVILRGKNNHNNKRIKKPHYLSRDSKSYPRPPLLSGRLEEGGENPHPPRPP